MADRSRLVALAGAAAGLGAGLVAQRTVLNKRRRTDPERTENFGERHGIRSRTFDLADGARIFVEEVGPESPRGAVFVHGSVLTTGVWHYQMGGLGDHRLVFSDIRGHGRSQPKGKAAYSMITLARDLNAVIDEARLKEVVIVGHSVGGQIALQLCHDRPDLMGERIRGLVLVNTSYGPFTETLIASGVIARLERLTRRPFDALGKQHERIERWRKLVRPSDAVFWGVALGAFGHNASPKQIDFAYDMLANTPVEVIFDLVRTYRDFDMTEQLGDITVPALVVGGTHDRLTLPKAAHYLAEHLPKADLHIFEGCGHMTMLERHEELNGLLETFLDDTLGAAKRRRRRVGSKA
jgi:pimeloyl-ACP methyl ester carboxylesterase